MNKGAGTISKQGYRLTEQLLSKAARDSDAVSMFALGTEWTDATGAIFVVKNGALAKQLHDEFVKRDLMTLGKRVVDRPSVSLCSDCPPASCGEVPTRCLPCPRRANPMSEADYQRYLQGI